ncbi:glycerate kinase [Nocardioides sp. ChNu-99]|uniref:glycerate kinase family protein n=1 Tax=Nocardioides sp. ChNu-99 TaxID=2839897 RepID=UPI00240743A5|nr:glycerate kinase [Nocardioides sp. ChNu-99]MDF9717310.1 glycerate kinase [Nocardioides sp. ChNu-99]
MMNVPGRVLIAPSGFKESLSAEQVADAIAAGVRRALPGVVVDRVPVVDGGEGSARTLAGATGGRLVTRTVTGPVGEPVTATLALLGGEARGTAVVEMAQAAGLRLVPAGLRDPGATTTRGVGELIRAALDEGARRILVGCGDSGTCDGGAGALQALGARVRDGRGAEVGPGGSALADVASLDLSGLDPRLADVDLLVACNPHNVLTGPRGVARVFGPQKGATPEQVELLAGALDRWAGVLRRDGVQAAGVDLATGPCTGASGGLGAGLAAGLGARLMPRFDVMLDHVDLDDLISRADLVITAEGAVDEQTPHGKVPAEVARRAKAQGKPVFALAGTIGRRAHHVHDIGIDAVASILPLPLSLEESIARCPELLTEAAERAMRLVLIGCQMGAA